MLILIHETEWGSDLRLPGDIPGVEVTLDQTRYDEANVVVFHLPEWFGSRRLTHVPASSRTKRPRQIWVAWTRECELHYPRVHQDSILKLFDVVMSYRRDSDVPLSHLELWFPKYAPDISQFARSTPHKYKPALAASFISSSYDQSDRLRYVSELMELMPIDSYGRFLRNQPTADDRGKETKCAIIAEYRFTLAFENAVSTDYVTEKFFEPLIAGSIPIYLGAPNIEDFAPGDHCYINVADFPEPRQLVTYLNYLDLHSAAFDEYFAWKSRELRPGFLTLMSEVSKHWIERLVDHLGAPKLKCI